MQLAVDSPRSLRESFSDGLKPVEDAIDTLLSPFAFFIIEHNKLSSSLVPLNPLIITHFREAKEIFWYLQFDGWRQLQSDRHGM